MMPSRPMPPAEAIARRAWGIDSGAEAGEDEAEQFEQEMARTYWARKPLYSEDYADSVMDLFEDHLSQARYSGLGDVIWRSYCTYLLLDAEMGSNVFGSAPIVEPRFTGDQGEFILTDVNHFRNLIKHKKALITGDRPAYNPQAATSDAQAMEQVNVARHLLDYMIDQRRLGDGMDQTAETALVMGCGWLHLGWDPYGGNPTGRVNPATGNPVYTGDLSWDSLTPFEVAHQKVRAYSNAHWHIVRLFASRFDLAARQADKGDWQTAQKLLSHDFTEGDYQYVMPTSGLLAGGESVPIYVVYHDRTPAMPAGRMSIVTGSGLVLHDGAMPFPEAPIYRMAPAEFIGTSVPFADSWSWLALHETANAMMSPIISRIDAFGNPIVEVPENGEWAAEDFYGFRLRERPMGSDPAQLLDFGNIPPSIPAAYNMMVSEMDRISGINSVVRGQPAENISSGSMAALVQAQAVSFNADDEKQAVYLGERACMGGIQLYQSMASEEMLITISGKEGEPSIEQFRRDRVSKIKRVTAKKVNPLMKTTAWKQEAAQQLLAAGLIKSPHEFLAIVETGTYETLFTDSTRLMALIREENAMLLRGEVPQVSQAEPFHLHWNEHAALLDQNAKDNPKVYGAIMKHLTDTIKAWQQLSLTSPSILIAGGVPVLPPPPNVQAQMAQMGAAQPQQGGEGEQKKPGPKPAGLPGLDNKAKAADKAPNMPNMPNMPGGEPAQV